MRLHKLGLGGAALALTAVMAATSARAEVLVDNVNMNEAADNGAFWGANDVGWLYTPSTSYSLSGVKTRFSIPNLTSIQDRTVTVAIYQGGTPANGGTLLGTFDFSSTLADNNTLGGGSFATPIALTAGTQYFIGFENVGPKSSTPNVDDLGVNFTADPAATFLSNLYFDSPSNGSCSAAASFACEDTNHDILGQAILALYGPSVAVPEPATWALFILGLFGLGATLRARKAPVAA